jgi:DNA adenine methylase
MSPSGLALRAPPAPRPFLKWAGGKKSLLPEIIERLPPPHSLRRYLEPFVGGGAVFFGLRALAPHSAMRIADRNPALIGAYLALRDRLEEVLGALARHARRHGRAHYYRVRRQVPDDPAEQAARLLYLNRTCYNGLWRVNRRGEFNVPMGRYREPRILDEANLRRVGAALQGVEIRCQDFEPALADCGPGDAVYCDPPYDPLSLSSNFTAYTAGGFGPDEQRRLACLSARLAARGVEVVVSNSDTAFIRSLYENLTPRPTLDRVFVPRAINSKKDGRRPVVELLIHWPGEPSERKPRTGR